MKIEVKDLKKGDEIIIPSQSKLKYVKLLADPVLHSTRKGWDYATRTSTKNYYKSVRCSIKSIQTPLAITNWRPKGGIKNDYQFEQDISQHNVRISLDLNYIDIFLVKREKY